MITKNFQKLGALVASLVGILTLSSAAEAITFTTIAGGVIGKVAPPSQVGASAITRYALNPGTPANASQVINFNSISINGLTYGNKGKLKATLKYLSGTDDEIAVVLFDKVGTGALTGGNYTFISSDATGPSLDWATSIASGTYKSYESFSAFEDVSSPSFLNQSWTLELQNSVNTATNVGAGSFSSFSIDASPVPFDSNAAPAGVVIVFGALMLRRKLQQSSAQKMSLESVNS